MERVELTVLSRATNASVVQLPERRFPGIVIQGDSLSVLRNLAEQVLLGQNQGSRAYDDAAELFDKLNRYLQAYEETLRAHGLERPYEGPWISEIEDEK